jgi:hypothetical protein
MTELKRIFNPQPTTQANDAQVEPKEKTAMKTSVL